VRLAGQPCLHGLELPLHVLLVGHEHVPSLQVPVEVDTQVERDHLPLGVRRRSAEGRRIEGAVGDELGDRDRKLEAAGGHSGS